MKKAIFKVLVVFILIAMSLFGLMFAVEMLAWEEKSVQISPDKDWELYHYRYISDINRHAPYGDYLILYRESLRFKNPKEGYVIFAGYCSDALDFKWVTNNHIQIFCRSAKEPKIRTISKQAFGKSIDYKYEPNL